MLKSPFDQLNIRLGFIFFFIIWAVLHYFILRSFNIDASKAASDSIKFNILLGLVSFLLCKNLGYYRPGNLGSFSILLLCMVLSAVILAADMRITELISGANQIDPKFCMKGFPIRFATTFLILSCMTMISILWYSQQDQNENQSRKKESEDLSRQAELFKLQQQLQPHFLFNCLNSIHALIKIDALEARVMIGQMSEFLRGTLRQNDEMVQLTDEITHIKLYLSIEKVRFGERLIVKIECPDNLLKFSIPSLILQPIVENAIKFGLYGVNGSVTISIIITGSNSELKINVINPYNDEGSSQIKGSGFGINSIRRRLYLIYGRNDLLNTIGNLNIYKAELTIPLKKIEINKSTFN